MNVLSVEMDDIKGVFAIDPATGRCFKLPLEEADPETAGRIAMAVYGQSSMSPYEVPHDQIREVMQAERSVSEESRKQYKRNMR